jgi:hypothetical protein
VEELVARWLAVLEVCGSNTSKIDNFLIKNCFVSFVIWAAELED